MKLINMNLGDMSLIEMSFAAAVMILAIIVVRALAINKLPKKVFLLLWDAVLLRLLIPYSIPSVFSAYTFVKRSEPIQEVITQAPTAGMITQMTGAAVNTGISSEIAVPNAVQSLSPLLIIWSVGFLLCAAFFVVSYVRCYMEFQTSLPVKNEFTVRWLRCHRRKRRIQIRQSDRISAPLTYGILKPVILMPKKTDWENRQQLEYVLLHEYTHICRFDMVTKLIAALALCIHWFNPFVWAMYILFNRDIELSCDESVVRRFGENTKSFYARALITMEEKKNGLTPLYNSFSRNAIEERITAIMKTKRVTRGIIVTSAFIIIAIVVLFATTAKVQSEEMLFVMGKVYTSTGEDVTEKVAGELAIAELDSPYIGVIETAVEKDQIPAKELQSNFGHIGAEIVFSGSGIAVNIDGKWIQFDRENNEAIINNPKEDVQVVPEAEGIIGEGVEEAGTALEMAKDVVSRQFTQMKDFGYINWRIDALTEEYAYGPNEEQSLGDMMRVSVYRLEYSFLAEDPKAVALAENMSMDEEGWAKQEYPASYLCVIADGGALSYKVLLDNDCVPGDEVFTADLKQLLGVGPETEDDYYAMVTSASAKEVEQFAAGVKEDVLLKDWESLSGKLAYPIQISGKAIQNAREFLAMDIDGKLNQEFVNAIAEESCREMFFNYQGIMMGATGQIWIASVESGSGQWELKVIALNGLTDKISLESVMNRVASKVGLENAIGYEKGYFELQKDALIKLCTSESGKHEAYGILSLEYGKRGILLNNIIEGEDNWNYFDSDWGYGKKTPKLIETGDYEVQFSYYLEDNSWNELYFDTYETGTMSVRVITQETQENTELEPQSKLPKKTVKEGSAMVDTTEVSSIVVINGNTGEHKTLIAEDDLAYKDLIKLYWQLDFSVQSEKNTRVGYQYSMILQDADGNKVQSITPYKDGVTVDGTFYQYDNSGNNTENNAEASLRLMEYLESIFDIQ